MTAHSKPYSILMISTALFLACSFRSVAFTQHTDHSLMNASSGTVLIDIHSSAQNITRFRAVPGSGLTFNGVFLRLTVHMASGKVRVFDTHQLQEIHSGTIPSNGAWLVEDSGVSSVSVRQFNLASRRFHKLWP
jgi:hypothetical protein